MLNKMGSNKMNRTKKDKSLDTEITQDLFGYKYIECKECYGSGELDDGEWCNECDGTGELPYNES